MAFPEDLSGIYSHDEMQQADTEINPLPSPRKVGGEPKPKVQPIDSAQGKPKLSMSEMSKSSGIGGETQGNDKEPAKKKANYDREWLSEKLGLLKQQNEKVWNDANVLSFIAKSYKVEAPSVFEAVDELDSGALRHFLAKVQEGLDKIAEERKSL